MGIYEFQSAMDRPIVVNSLLCFIQNFRNHPQLEVLTRGYFSKPVCDSARATLMAIFTDADDDTSDLSLFELLDKTNTLDPVPIFVAADLTSLPMVLIGEQNQSKTVIDEIHQLRFFVQSIFDNNNQIFKK